MHLCKHFFPHANYFLLYISCLPTIYFVFLAPANIFSIFFIPPLEKNNGPSLKSLNCRFSSLFFRQVLALTIFLYFMASIRGLLFVVYMISSFLVLILKSPNTLVCKTIFLLDNVRSGSG